jgi:hypothetical protein
MNNKNYKKDLFALLASCQDLKILLENVFGDFLITVSKKSNEEYNAYRKLINHILNKKGFEDFQNNFTIFKDLHDENVLDGGDIDWQKVIKPNLSKLIRQILKKIDDFGFDRKLEKTLLLDHVRVLVTEANMYEKVAARLTYNNKRELEINGHLLSKPNFESDNDKMFYHIFQNPNRAISKKEIEEEMKIKIGSKKFTQMISDLRFKGLLKKLFFPNVSAQAIFFRNPIYMKNLCEEDVLLDDFIDFLSKIERSGKK